MGGGVERLGLIFLRGGLEGFASLPACRPDFIVWGVVSLCIHTSGADADQRLGALIIVAPVRFPCSAFSRYPTY